MFRKVTNADLLNRLAILENKIDIVTTRLNSESICACKPRDTSGELKDYLETKFAELTNRLTSECIQQKTLSDTFESYKIDIMDNLQSIITNLSISNTFNEDVNKHPVSACTNDILEGVRNELANQKSDILKLNLFIENKLHKLTTLLDRSVKETSDKFVQIESRFIDLDGRLNSIYFENELIKHQLILEDDIRKTIDEVNVLSKMISETINQIDNIKQIDNINL